MMFSTVAIAAFAGLAAAAPVKRGFGGRATYYATGLGSCGQMSSDSDFIVALNSPQYGSGYPGPNCFKQIQISANGKTATATIMDQCPGCGYGDLDMSPALFNHFADPSVGVFQMSWDFVGAAPAPAPEPTSTYVAPTSTYTPPAPTSTWVAPAPTSTWVAPTTTSETPSSTWVAPSSSSVPVEVKVQATSSAQPSSSSVWSESSSSSAAPTTTSSSSVDAASTSAATTTSSAPVPTITVDLGSGNLAELCEAVARMGKLVVVGASLANGTAVNIANTTLTLE